MNCNIIIRGNTVHQQPAPHQEFDLWELQAAQLNPHRLPHSESQRNIARLLLLLLEGAEQAACIWVLSCQLDYKLSGVAVTLVEFWQTSFTELSACVPNIQAASAFVVDADLLVGVSRSDAHVEGGRQALIIIEIELGYLQFVHRELWKLWSENEEYNSSSDGNQNDLEQDQAYSPTKAPA